MSVERYGSRGALVRPAASESELPGLASELSRRLPSYQVVVGGASIAVFEGGERGEPSELLGAVERAWAKTRLAPIALAPEAEHTIDAVYDGPDLDEVATRLGLSRDGVVSLHAAGSYRVALVGFLPGFAYLRGLPPQLALARRASPRPVVPAGAVGVAAGYTGVYPLRSAGGWHLLGRAVGPAPFDPHDVGRARPGLFSAGDRVRFRPVEAGELALASAPPWRPERPALRVVRAAGVATIQDGGRRGLLGQGVPASGPLDLEAHALANLAVGNPPFAAVVELATGTLELEALRKVRVAWSGEAAVLAPGDRVRVGPGLATLAVEGGVDAPVVLGSRSTLLAARLGGLGGGPLARGDVLGAGGEQPAGSAHEAAGEREVWVEPGPDVERLGPGGFERFVSLPWRRSARWDRTGARLEGATFSYDGDSRQPPLAMCRGAIELTPDGTPIVLGPDHPTTGGYPVVALLRPPSWSAFARTKPGDEVRLRA